MTRLNKTDFAVFKETCVWVFRIASEATLLHALNVEEWLRHDELSQVGYADSEGKLLAISPNCDTGENIVIINLETKEKHSGMPFVAQAVSLIQVGTRFIALSLFGHIEVWN